MNRADENSGLVEQYKSSSKLEARISLHERFSVSKKRWPEWVFDQVDFSSHSEVLELGCGIGNLWSMNRERIGKGWSVLLGDFSQGMVDKARVNLDGFKRNFHFAVMDAGDIPFRDGRFEIVIANHMLYHVPELDRTLEEIRRVLVPEGVLYASTNGEGHMAELDELMPEGLPFKPVGEVIGNFTLENGSELLGKYFNEVELRRHEDGLVVTEVRPLVDYALSRLSIFSSGAPISREIRDTFLSKVARKLREGGGAIRITKDSGIFICRK